MADRTWTKDEIKALINSNDVFMARCLVKIYDRQTADEQNAETTCHSNGVGFSGAHANFGTILAKAMIKWGSLKGGQISAGRKIALRYTRQLADIANEAAEDEGLTCVDCGGDDASLDWETLEDISLCLECAKARPGKVPQEWHIEH